LKEAAVSDKLASIDKIQQRCLELEAKAQSHENAE
jgi:hypothetical protein